MRKSFFGDRVFFLIVLILVVGGFAIFASASLGLLARIDSSPEKLILTQIVFGLIPGALAILALRITPLTSVQKVAPYIYGLTILGTLLVFSPLGETLNGATRWIDIGITTIQPSEFLKIGVVLMLAWYFAKAKGELHSITKGLIPFVLILGVPAAILLAQPNTSTVLVLGLTGVAMYIAAGASWRDLLILFLGALILFGGLVAARPYLLDRVQTFINPARDAYGSGYQIQQSLIAIGSGGVAGRGFGQSVQKFNYLPEPVGDSVFAVYAEEFGFIGAIVLVLLFAAFAARGLSIAADASTLFGSLVAMGLTLVISISAFFNISAMLGLAPLTGLPLPFVSHGGTALFAALISVGIILKVASTRKSKA